MAEFGFLGVIVKTRVQTPLFWGLRSNAGALLLYLLSVLPFLTSWFTVGKTPTPLKKIDFIHPKENIPRRMRG
jgi:uncharacterized membrane protein